MSKEKINYNILSLLLSDCKYSKKYKVVNLDNDTVFLERSNRVKFPFSFSILKEEISKGGNKQLGNYIEERFKETLLLPY